MVVLMEEVFEDYSGYPVQFPFKERYFTELVSPSTIVPDIPQPVTYRDPFGRVHQTSEPVTPFHFDYFGLIKQIFESLLPEYDIIDASKQALFKIYEENKDLAKLRPLFKEMMQWVDDCRRRSVDFDNEKTKLAEILDRIKIALDEEFPKEVFLELEVPDFIPSRITRQHLFMLSPVMNWSDIKEALNNKLIEEIIKFQLGWIVSDLEQLIALEWNRKLLWGKPAPFSINAFSVLPIFKMTAKDHSITEFLYRLWNNLSQSMEQSANWGNTEVLQKEIVTVNLETGEFSRIPFEKGRKGFFKDLMDTMEKIKRNFGGFTPETLFAVSPAYDTLKKNNPKNKNEVLKKELLGCVMNADALEYRYISLNYIEWENFYL